MRFNKTHFQKWLALPRRERNYFTLLLLPFDLRNSTLVHIRAREAVNALRPLYCDPDIAPDFEGLKRGIGEASVRLATPAGCNAYREELVTQEFDSIVRILAESDACHPLTTRERDRLIRYACERLAFSRFLIVRTVDKILRKYALGVQEHTSATILRGEAFRVHCRLALADGGPSVKQLEYLCRRARTLDLRRDTAQKILNEEVDAVGVEPVPLLPTWI